LNILFLEYISKSQGGKEMKRIMAVLFSLVLVIGLGACTAKKTGYTIGLSMNDMGNPFISYVEGGIAAAAEADKNTVSVADAASNVQTQISQIENFITMKVDAIFIFATDPVALADVTTRAHNAGIKIITAGGTIAGADVSLNVDQYKWGEQSSQLMIDWSTTTFGNTTGKVIVVKSTSTDQAALRSNGIIDKLTTAGFEVVVSSTEGISAAEGRTIIENMWQQNSDAIGVVTYNADAAAGINEFIMAQAGYDFSKFAIYSCDTSDSIKALINQSKTNLSVFRGTVGIGGPTIDGTVVDLPGGIYTIITRSIKGEAVGYTGDSVVTVLPE
jgi:ribose transport system substrate-binding protein